MSGLYRYSIIRFRPFAETGEFANVGVLVADVQTGRATFRLAAKRFPRIKYFFDKAYDSYRKANVYLRDELERAVHEVPLLMSKGDEFFLSHFVREREASIIFSPPRVLKSDDDLSAVSDILYDRYVGRNFETLENVEVRLTKGIRDKLRSHGITHFKTIRLEDDVAPIILPLAYRSNEIYGIKPLAFSQKTPLGILDHGSNWKTRFEYLVDKGRLKPKNILLALDPPHNEDSSFQEAYEIVKSDLNRLPFQKVVVDQSYLMDQIILDFASKAPLDKRILTRH
jgi:hypothetical protein